MDGSRRLLTYYLTFRVTGARAATRRVCCGAHARVRFTGSLVALPTLVMSTSQGVEGGCTIESSAEPGGSPASTLRQLRTVASRASSRFVYKVSSVGPTCALPL